MKNHASHALAFFLAVGCGLCGQAVLAADAAAPPPQPPAPAPRPAVPVAPVAPKSPVAAAVTKLKITPPELEMGKVQVWESRTQGITLENPTDTAITVKNIHASCGCVTLDMPVAAIAPGKSEVLNVKYTGQFGIPSKTVIASFNTDEDASPEVKIPLHLKTKQEFTVEPSMIQFGRINKGETKSMDTVIKSVDGKPFVIQEVRGPSKEFSCTWVPVAGSNGAAMKVTATVTAAKGGALTQTASFVTDRTELRGTVPVNLLVDVIADVTCAPSPVAAAIGSDNLAAPFETLVKRTSPGKLEIQRVTEARQTAIDFTVKPVDDSSAQLTIRLKDPIQQRPLVGQFLIQTNAEENAIHLPYRLIRGPIVTPPAPR